MAEEQPPVVPSEEPGSGSVGNSAPAPPESIAAAMPSADDVGSPDQAGVDDILKQASFEDVSQAVAPHPEPNSAASAQADASAAATAVAAPPEDFHLPDLQQVMQDAQVSSIDLLRDVDLNVKIELGRTRMLVEDVLKLGEGSVVELDKLAGDPVDVFVNERLVARGEVLVLNDNFCVRINEIVAGARDDDL